MLSKFSVRRPYTVVVAVVLVLILGVISFMNLQTDLLPKIDLPYILIITSYPGASPEEVEMVVTRPVEQTVATVDNIKNVSSISRENSSIVILEFNNDVNLDSATIELNSLLDLVKPAWPDMVGSPMLMRLNPDMLPIMVASVDVEGMDLIEISQLVNQDIIPELESVNGVASVTGAGLLEERIEVLIDGDKIDDLNKRILAAIDSELAQAEEELMKAKEEIESGKEKLASEEKKQSQRLSQGQKALTEAKKQIGEAESKIVAGELELDKAERELQAKLSEINQQERELKTVQGLVLSIKNKMPEMKKEELQKALLELFNNLPQDIKDRIGQGLERLEKSLAEGGRLKPGDIRETIENLSQELENNLKLISAGKAEIEKGLEQIYDKKEELVKQKTLLASKKDELSLKEQELATGKLMLSMEMDKAKTQLETGEQTLNEKMDEFEKAREEAFKKASLDGVITPDMVSGILTAQNFSMPAGSISEEDGEYLVKVGDEIKDVQQLENLVLFDTGDKGIGKIYLKDVAEISQLDNSEETYAKVNGNNAVMLTFQKQSNFSTAQVAASIREKFEELTSRHQGLNITPLMDQGVYIDIVVDSVLDNVVYGGLLAILVLILFLKDIRPTIVIAVSIPVSLIAAIAMMYFTGVTINIISLGGLALGVGMLVDNSIVVIENIYRLRNLGKSPKEAAIEGAKEISAAIISSTLTTMCVFLPIVFVKGISRQVFIDMGLTIAYSLVASLIVALSLVPAMASNMLGRISEKRNKTFEKFTNWYSRMLAWSLRHRALVMIVVVVLLGVSIYLAASMGTAFIPDMDTPQMSVTIEMPGEASFEDTIQMSDTVVDRIMEIEGIDTIGAFQSGLMEGLSMGGGGSNSNVASLYLLLDENKRVSNKEIEKQIYELTEDLECEISVSTSNMDLSALGGSGIQVLVKGREIDTLQETASDIAKILEETEGTIDVSDGIEDTMTELRIIVDKEKAMENGLTVAQVYSSVNSTISKGKTATTLSVDNKDYPVIVIDKTRQDTTKENLEKLTIKGAKNEEEVEVTIGDIAEIVEGKGLAAITRDSQERYLSISAGIDPDYNIGLVSREFENKLEDYKLPEGYKIEFSGENKMIADSLNDLSFMILLAVVFIYLIMVAQFQSLLSPFIVMFTIPLAFTGGLIALAITGHVISVVSMLGFLVLSGVVVNNGIVFVDFTNQLRERGLDKTEALMEAGKTRLKPILMTAITTILGLFTLALGVGMGAEMLQPLAIVSIGGLTYATALTLLVVPVMYHLLHRGSKKKAVGEGGA
ncbi:MAG: efflux RND transporter permease subunit [Caldicoprobacterales bacterium]